MSYRPRPPLSSSSSSLSSVPSSPRYLAGLSVAEHVRASIDQLEHHYKRINHSQTVIKTSASNSRFIPEPFIPFSSSPLFTSLTLAAAAYLEAFLECLQRTQKIQYKQYMEQQQQQHGFYGSYSSPVDSIAIPPARPLSERLHAALQRLARQYSELLMYRMAHINDGFSNQYYDAAFFECVYLCLEFTMARVFIPLLAAAANGSTAVRQRILIQAGDDDGGEQYGNGGGNSAGGISKRSGDESRRSREEAGGAGAENEEQMTNNISVNNTNNTSVATNAPTLSVATGVSPSLSASPVPPINLSSLALGAPVAVAPRQAAAVGNNSSNNNTSGNNNNNTSSSAQPPLLPSRSLSIRPGVHHSGHVPMVVPEIPPIRFEYLQRELARIFRSPNFLQSAGRTTNIHNHHHHHHHQHTQGRGGRGGPSSSAAHHGRRAHSLVDSGAGHDNNNHIQSPTAPSTPSTGGGGLSDADSFLAFSGPHVPAQPFLPATSQFPSGSGSHGHLLRSLGDLRSPLLCSSLPAFGVLINDNHKYVYGNELPHINEREWKQSMANEKKAAQDEYSQQQLQSKLPSIKSTGNRGGHENNPSSFRIVASSRLSVLSARMTRLVDAARKQGSGTGGSQGAGAMGVEKRNGMNMISTGRSYAGSSTNRGLNPNPNYSSTTGFSSARSPSYGGRSSRRSLDERLRDREPIVRVSGRNIELA